MAKVNTGMGVLSAASMGIGGMIGAGIFSILGVMGGIAGSAAWIGFLGAGVLALFCGHSYAKLGGTFPSAGGPVTYLVKGFGVGRLSGSLNIMLWLGYVLALALYASAFAGYAGALLGGAGDGSGAGAWLHPALSVGVIALFLLLNVLGSAAVGKAEGLIVGIKLVILLGFVGVTAFSVDTELLSTSHWAPSLSIANSMGVAFLAYEGFGLITNTAADMPDPKRMMPRAIFLAIGATIVVYVLVVLATFGNLSAAQIAEKSEYALAAAAEPALGKAGFVLMGVAALFSTASAINATLFGGANVSAQVASEGELPEVFDHKVWHGSRAGLFITAVLVALLASTMPLGSIANTGSAAFLVIYAFVCVGHLRLRKQTGASAWPIWCAVVGCAGVLALLLVHLSRRDLTSLIGFLGLIGLSVLFEWVYFRYRRSTRRASAGEQIMR